MPCFLSATVVVNFEIGLGWAHRLHLTLPRILSGNLAYDDALTPYP